MTTRFPCIRSAIRREETVLRLGGDCYPAGITWTADDRQLLAIIDGSGWPEIPKRDYYSSRLFTLDGSPHDATFEDLSGYPDIWILDFIKGGPPYYAFNALAVDGRIYQYLSTENHSYSAADSASWVNLNVCGAKLIYSPDNGRTWCNQDGSTPVVQESRGKQSQRNMAFFHERHSAFSYLTFLQMGRDYQDNRDGYVYVYSPNGITDGHMNELAMFRAPKDRILDRGAYEYFVRVRADGSADWIKDIEARGVVHTFPRGLVPMPWPISWLPSVAYNAPLGVYMMVNCSGVRADCIADKPSYLGIWIAAKPWGPWTQIHEETAWTPAADPAARAAGPQIAPKWIAKDGKSFWLVWTDVQQNIAGDLNEACYNAKTHEEWMQARPRWRRHHPYFAFNTQRVDLVVG